MMKRLLPFLAGLLPMLVQAQLFTPPQPLMYRPMSEAEAPPQHCRRIVVSRYIPGARFPHSWDVQLEERSYDPKGRLTNWKRFDAFSGVRIYEKKVTWNAQGDRTEERTWRAELAREDVWKFNNQYGPDGRFTGASLTDDKGKVIGNISVTPDGGRLFSLGTTPGTRMLFAHDAKGRMTMSADEPTKLEDRFRYDGKGELTEIERIRNGSSSTIKYKNSYDDQGHLIVQEEQFPQGVRKMLFEYNDKGQLVTRKWEPVVPAESYTYTGRGHLSDIMQYGQEGYPKESQAYWTEYYQ